MLVTASMMIWGTQITALQFFGYFIALSGMVYYKLGYDQMGDYTGKISRRWREFGARKTTLYIGCIVVLCLSVSFLLLKSLMPVDAASNQNPDTIS
jgi:multidrug transporter EmrE-like cation transporter